MEGASSYHEGDERFTLAGKYEWKMPLGRFGVGGNIILKLKVCESFDWN
jgi:hypothetical protein